MSDEFSLHDAIHNCRAMRRLKSDEVPEELLIQLVDAAVKKQLADLNRLHAEPYIQPNLENPESEKQKRMLDAVVWQMAHMHEIPALIVACFDYPEKVEGLSVYRSAGSVWPGIQNLLLTARALGLGAAPTTLALRDQDAVRAALKLPETFAALCLIPVGYPMGRFGPVSRKPVSEIMRFDHWS